MGPSLDFDQGVHLFFLQSVSTVHKHYITSLLIGLIQFEYLETYKPLSSFSLVLHIFTEGGFLFSPSHFKIQASIGILETRERVYIRIVLR